MDYQYDTSVWSVPYRAASATLSRCPNIKTSVDTHLTFTSPLSTANGGQYPSADYVPPFCPPGAVRCGICHRVDNIGFYGSSANDQIYGSVIVEIVDACPAGNAQNYCKTDVPADERCGSDQINSLDIDFRAYQNLTAGMDGGMQWDAVSLSVESFVGCLLMRLCRVSRI